jgi:hypothetical protein
LQQLLRQLLPAKEPVLVKGTPGIGKTQIVEAVTKELGYDLIVMHPVVDDPTDYKGLPGVVRGADDAGPEAEFLPFGNLRKLRDARRPLVAFADDLGQAPGAVQAAFMQLLLARQINGQPISPEVRFVAATNNRRDKAGVAGLITPLLDRFTTVIELEFMLEDFRDWMLANGMPGILPAFAKFKPDVFNKFDPTLDMEKSPTPRSIAGLGRLLNLGVDSPDVVQGAVGQKFAIPFLAYYRTWKELPDPEEVLKHPKTHSVPPEEKLDVLFALMGALAHFADDDNLGRLAQYLQRCPPEMNVLCMKDVLKRDPEKKHHPEFSKWAQLNRKLLGNDAAQQAQA